VADRARQTTVSIIGRNLSCSAAHVLMPEVFVKSTQFLYVSTA